MRHFRILIIQKIIRTAESYLGLRSIDSGVCSRLVWLSATSTEHAAVGGLQPETKGSTKGGLLAILPDIRSADSRRGMYSRTAHVPLRRRRAKESVLGKVVIVIVVVLKMWNQ